MSYKDNKLLEKGTYKGVPFYIIETSMGWPCSYIDVSKVDGFEFDLSCDNNEICCHGGCTYADYKLGVGDEVFRGNIVGWDYAHLGDWVPCIPDCSDHKWTLDELRAEVFEVIDDLLEREA